MELDFNIFVSFNESKAANFFNSIRGFKNILLVYSFCICNWQATV